MSIGLWIWLKMRSLPTPPRSRHRVQLPTPETDRRPSKRLAKPTSTTLASTSTLPTPQTLPRPPRSKPVTVQNETEPPSPSGHTTFFLSSNASSSSQHRGEATIRRRPGLTFAQQMGLSSTQAGPSTTGGGGSTVSGASGGFGGRLGVGVGMGGTRSGGHKVDQITIGRLDESVELDNPFVVPGCVAAWISPNGLNTPGRSTHHRPAIMGDDGEDDVDHVSSPTRPRRKVIGKGLQSPPVLVTDPVNSTTSLLSPPPTQKALRFGPVPPSPRATARQTARQARAEMLRQMRDEDSNPFLVKPGSRPAPRSAEPIVDESRPTVTYVFRGAKKVFANPFADGDLAIAGSDLDPEDDEYEPHPCPNPKLLWPVQPRLRQDEKRDGEGSELMRTPGRRLISGNTHVSEDVSPRSHRGGGGDGHGHGRGHDRGHMSDKDFVREMHGGALDEPIPVRRGLLFGPGSMAKRGTEGDQT